MDKKHIVAILEEIGTMLELQGENPFKSRAYFNAARAIESTQQDVQELIRSGKISQIKGIGKALTEKLTELVETGRLAYYENLKASFPPGLLEMLKIPGMGPKKVKTVYDILGITTIGELEYACKENRLRDLNGFGQKTQEKILKGIELRRKYSERFFYPEAWQQAQQLAAYLREQADIIRLEIAGSLRRKRETVKDIDLVASCEPQHRQTIMEYFTNFPGHSDVVGRGQTKSTIILQSGISCDLRLVDDAQFPFLLHHFTGSKEHNTALRRRAKNMKLTMNEYGLFPQGSNQSLSCADESQIFNTLKLPFIPPELRENQGEIEAAENNTLPQLVRAEQFKGLFHAHSTYSDGAASIEEMARACQQMGLQYLGITDHSKSAFYANGLSEDRIKQQHEEIDMLNARLNNFIVLKGIEVDILPDGRLDYTDDVLEAFDFVIASVHSAFKMSEKDMTQRICRALQHPLVTMLGHPSGRLLLGREPYPLNMAQVLETAARYGKIVEINANPHRLDMDWRWGKLANELGIQTAVNPDAHTVEGLQDYLIGVGIARKGWFTAEGVLNTLDKEQLLPWLHKRR